MNFLGEGNSHIIETAGEGIVKKCIKRRAIRTLVRRGGLLGIEDQFRVHMLAASILADYTHLYTPRPLECTGGSYTMERISTDEYVCNLVDAEQEELERFVCAVRRAGWIAFDYELYRQTDGRIAIIDFNRFQRCDLQK